jgi:hypothetical protein
VKSLVTSLHTKHTDEESSKTEDSSIPQKNPSIKNEESWISESGAIPLASRRRDRTPSHTLKGRVPKGTWLGGEL